MLIEPSNFPSTNPISSLCIIAARENGNDALILANAILAALWEDDRNIDDPEVLKNICFENKLDGNQILTIAETTKIEQLFETDTQEAIKKDNTKDAIKTLEFIEKKLGKGFSLNSNSFLAS